MSNVKCQMSNVSRGFTLLEFLIYISILTIAMLSVLGILNITARIRATQSARSETNRNLQFIIERTNYLGIQADAFGNCPNASSAICSATSTQVDFIGIAGEGITSSVFLESGALKFKEMPTSTSEDLTTSQVIAETQDSVPLFQKIGDTVQMKISVRYNDQGNKLFQYEISGQTTISIR